MNKCIASIAVSSSRRSSIGGSRRHQRDNMGIQFERENSNRHDQWSSVSDDLVSKASNDRFARRVPR